MSTNDKKPHYAGHRERLRQEVLQNPKEAPEYKVLELMLTYAQPRVDTKQLARNLLKKFGSLREVVNADRENLLEVESVGPSTADFLALFREFRARYEESPIVRGKVLCTNKGVADMARARLDALRTEHLWAAFVDTRLHLLAWESVAQGTLNAAHFYPQEIIRLCLKHHAWGFFLVHNHPGGSGPSQMDVLVTDKMIAAARAAGMCLVEHLIVTENNYYGLREEGIIASLSETDQNL